MAIRILGLVFLVLGLWLAHEFIYEPWSAMQAGAASIEVGTKAVVFAPMMVGLSLLFLLQGNGIAEFLEEDGAQRRQGAVILIATLALGIGMKEYLYNQARDGGYRGPGEMSDTLDMPTSPMSCARVRRWLRSGLEID